MLRHPVLTALALVAPLVLLLASCGEDEPAVADTPSTATVESDGVTVDLSYDADGLTAVFHVGSALDLSIAKTLDVEVGISDDGGGVDYGVVLEDPTERPLVMDTEGNELSCRQRVATDPDAGTLTVTYPARCTSTDDPKPRKDLMADPLHVGTTFEATFPGGRSIDAETADVVLQRS